MRQNILIVSVLFAPVAQAFAPSSFKGSSPTVLAMTNEEESTMMNRRSVLSFTSFAAASCLLGTKQASALDMDAFMNAEVCVLS